MPRGAPYQDKDDNEEAKCVESIYFSFPLLLSDLLLFTKYLLAAFFKITLLLRSLKKSKTKNVQIYT